MAYHRVRPGTRVRLGRIDPADTGKHADEAAARAKLGQDIARLAKLQDVLYAERRHAVLVVLQGMDTSGKDGTVKHVMSGVNPSGCEVVPFKVPTEEEAAHDFLWRAHRAAPRRGHITIFNRSHYEDVLVVRVKKMVPRPVWKERFDLIDAFERTLAQGNCIVLKYFLHITEDEQERRLLAREKDPNDAWKLNLEDWKERDLWDEFTAAYEDAIGKCAARHAPWIVVPANAKWYRNLVIAESLAAAMRPYRKRWRLTLDEEGKIVRRDLKEWRASHGKAPIPK